MTKACCFKTTILVFFCNTLFAQDKVIKVNTVKDVLLKAIYVYHDFTEGRVHLKDNSTVEALLNYNRLNSDILFIAYKKGTLALNGLEATDNIITGSDIYFYVSGAYVKQLTAYPAVNLVQK